MRTVNRKKRRNKRRKHSEDMTSQINFDIWQYSARGHVDGIDGEVDLDVMISS